jgi:hypothetical protein
MTCYQSRLGSKAESKSEREDEKARESAGSRERDRGRYDGVDGWKRYDRKQSKRRRKGKGRAPLKELLVAPGGVAGPKDCGDGPGLCKDLGVFGSLGRVGAGSLVCVFA